MKLQINIFDNDLIWRGAIDAVKNLTHRTSWHEIKNSELTIGKSAQGIEEMGIGRILVINNQLDKALIVEDMVTSLDDEFWTFTLVPLKGMLNYRICHPTDSGAGGAWVAKKQTQVMQWMVSDNLITQTRDIDRYFWNSAKTKNLLEVTPIKSYGDTIDFSVDWDTGYLGDAIVTVSKMYGEEANYPMGWNIAIKDDYSGFLFDCNYGTHKHINQTILPPVVFSEEFGNIKNASYEYSIKEWRNIIYMVWKEEGADTIEKANAVWDLRYGYTHGFNRKETIIDSSKKILTEVKAEGRSELNKRPHVESFTAEIINNENTMTTYKKDWVVGDIVTIQSREIFKGLQISMDAMITGIEEIYDEGEYSINAIFGEERLTFLQLIKNAINQK